MSEEKKKKWTAIGDVSEEDIARMLNEREGGRKAGRGDSPYTQEFYEETYGIKSKKKEGEKNDDSKT